MKHIANAYDICRNCLQARVDHELGKCTVERPIGRPVFELLVEEV